MIGRLLISGIQAFRAQANQPGYDILALNRAGTSSTRIQVKSRAATDAGSVRFKSENLDFAVVVRLNLGARADLLSGHKSEDLRPEFYVFKRADITFESGKARLGVVRLGAPHLDAWHLISEALGS